MKDSETLLPDLLQGESFTCELGQSEGWTMSCRPGRVLQSHVYEPRPLGNAAMCSLQGHLDAINLRGEESLKGKSSGTQLDPSSFVIRANLKSCVTWKFNHQHLWEDPLVLPQQEALLADAVSGKRLNIHLTLVQRSSTVPTWGCYNLKLKCCLINLFFN